MATYLTWRVGRDADFTRTRAHTTDWRSVILCAGRFLYPQDVAMVLEIEMAAAAPHAAFGADSLMAIMQRVLGDGSCACTHSVDLSESMVIYCGKNLFRA